jgi:hypothetical protein
VEHVLSSSSPSFFTEHLINMNDLNDLLCACPHTRCTKIKKNRDSTKKYEYHKCCYRCSYRINLTHEGNMILFKETPLPSAHNTASNLQRSTSICMTDECISGFITKCSIICLTQTMVQRRYVTNCCWPECLRCSHPLLSHGCQLVWLCYWGRIKVY